MRTYLLYVTDDRYSVPTLDMILASDDESATRRAVQRLAASPHHMAVEMWDNERLVCRLNRGDLDEPPR